MRSTRKRSGERKIFERVTFYARFYVFLLLFWDSLSHDSWAFWLLKWVLISKFHYACETDYSKWNGCEFVELHISFFVNLLTIFLLHRTTSMLYLVYHRKWMPNKLLHDVDVLLLPVNVAREPWTHSHSDGDNW